MVELARPGQAIAPMELAQATRNRGMPLEALRHDVTPATTMPVTFECAGNGRARLEPRPMTQPWLYEAVPTGSWTGTSLAGVLEEAGVEPDTVEIVFTGADHGIEGGEELDYARSLPLAEAMRPEVILAYEMNGRPLEPQHGFRCAWSSPGGTE